MCIFYQYNKFKEIKVYLPTGNSKTTDDNI